ncbi:MAG: hypothetical protein IPI04_19575 [Ignavibacteria bacterium]|nr:hypothetical protein [Ignavibacteria bacterium]
MFKYIIFLFFLIGCSKTNNNSQGNQTDKINNTEVENSDSISYSNDSTIKILKHPILIGDTKIYVKTSESKSAIPIRYFNMHDNENTSVDAALSILTKYGGKIIEFDANYSIESYLQGEENDKDASEVKINKEWDPDDFFFVTDEIILQRIIKI